MIDEGAIPKIECHSGVYDVESDHSMPICAFGLIVKSVFRSVRSGRPKYTNNEVDFKQDLL